MPILTRPNVLNVLLGYINLFDLSGNMKQIFQLLLCYHCYAAVLLKFTYYAQEQESLSDYYGIYIQFCMSNSLHVTESFIRLY